MTYQLAMRGRDGILIASDRREISFHQTASVLTKNDVTKIAVSPDGEFAWAYSGHDVAAGCSSGLARATEKEASATDESMVEALTKCGLAALREWQAQASGAAPLFQPVILLASAATARVFRYIIRPSAQPEEMKRGLCIAGQAANWSAFFPERLYSSEMSIEELSCLAAISIRVAHDFDPLSVDRLDIAICRNAARRLELIDGDQRYWDDAEELSRRIDASMRGTMRDQAADRARSAEGD